MQNAVQYGSLAGVNILQMNDRVKWWKSAMCLSGYMNAKKGEVVDNEASQGRNLKKNKTKKCMKLEVEGRLDVENLSLCFISRA